MEHLTCLPPALAGFPGKPSDWVEADDVRNTSNSQTLERLLATSRIFWWRHSQNSHLQQKHHLNENLSKESQRPPKRFDLKRRRLLPSSFATAGPRHVSTDRPCPGCWRSRSRPRQTKRASARTARLAVSKGKNTAHLNCTKVL